MPIYLMEFAGKNKNCRWKIQFKTFTATTFAEPSGHLIIFTVFGRLKQLESRPN